MKAIIMAGGFGTRLRPLTCGRPKPLLSVMNKPVMEYTIDLLKKHGITEIGVTLQYLPEDIKNYFGDGSDWGVHIEYFVEEVPLGTAGSVKNAEGFLNDTFVVISGDALTDVDINKAVEFHKKNNSITTLILKEVEVPLDYGVVVTETDGKIRRFLEKPSWSEVFSNTVNTGMYILEPEALTYFEKGKNFDFSKDLFPLLMNNNKTLYGFTTEDYWCDIGDIQSYVQAHADILNKKVRVELREKEVRKGVFVGEGVEIHADALIEGPAVIGDHCKIGKGVKIHPYTVMGKNVIVHNHSSVKRSIVWDNSIIGTDSKISGSILCYRTNLKSNVTAYEQAVIGDDTLLRDRAIVKPNVKIWPHKVIESGAIASENIIWGTKHSKVLFGKHGIAGDINVELTPEFASKIGTAFATALKQGSKVCISSDQSSAGKMLKYALVSGCIAGGLEVYELENTVMPITRNIISFLDLDGGIHIKMEQGSSSKCSIKFMGKDGIEISKAFEKKIENTYTTGEFHRCELSRVKSLNSLNEYNYFYIQNLLKSVDIKNIKSAALKIVAGEVTPFIFSLLKQICDELKCELVYKSQYNKDNFEKLSLEVLNSKADFGFIMDDSSEKMLLIDDKGRIVKNDLYTALISLVSLKVSMNNSVVVPITASSVMEKLASQHNARIIRTKTGREENMSAIVKDSKAAGEKGVYILHYDAFAAMVKMLDFISREKIKLSGLVESIPSFYMTQKSIECPWEAKGKVIRSLIQEKSDGQIELYEGVKIFHDKGWVLVLPDSDEPVCNIYSEGVSKELAESLSETYVDKIKSIIAG
jgi:mannose-1-phosphate guanylyltransferase/phosphomannomutase